MAISYEILFLVVTSAESGDGNEKKNLVFMIPSWFKDREWCLIGVNSSDKSQDRPIIVRVVTPSWVRQNLRYS